MLQPAAASLGGILLYAGGSNVSHLVWLDRAGKTLEVLSEADRQSHVRISPDGKRFITVRAQYPAVRGNDVWLMSLERHVLSLFVPAVRELTPLARDSNYWSALWSPDSGTVLLDRGRFIFRKAIAASGEGERIAEWPALRRLCDWSRDGRYVLYETSDPETRRDLWVAPVTPDGRLAEGAEPKPYLHGPFAEWQGRFSPEPNPRWVAYQSDESGQNEIYIASFPDARRKLQVTAGGGTFPQWGPDGRELFYISGDGMLSVVGLKNGAEGLEVSAPLALFPLTAISAIASPYEVSPDGKRILVNQAQPITRLDVVVNWPLLLRGQAAQ
jgi:Tol biopolymer transport system component